MMPICITEKTDTDRYAQYRFPNDAPFETLFFNNLKNKYQTAVKQNSSENASDNEDPSVLQLKILGQYRTAKFEVPQGFDKKPIEVRGATFDFEITAPTVWLEVGYAAGFGEKNSGGFGFCEIL